MSSINISPKPRNKYSPNASRQSLLLMLATITPAPPLLGAINTFQSPTNTKECSFSGHLTTNISQAALSPTWTNMRLLLAHSKSMSKVIILECSCGQTERRGRVPYGWYRRRRGLTLYLNAFAIHREDFWEGENKNCPHHDWPRQWRNGGKVWEDIRALFWWSWKCFHFFHRFLPLGFSIPIYIPQKRRRGDLEEHLEIGRGRHERDSRTQLQTIWDVYELDKEHNLWQTPNLHIFEDCWELFTEGTTEDQVRQICAIVSSEGWSPEFSELCGFDLLFRMIGLLNC